MEITKIQNGTTLNFAISGRLDSYTSPNAQSILDASFDGIQELIFDFDQLTYVSSAGLRLILTALKQMKKQGSMKIIHVNENLMALFQEVGFCDIMTIEKK